MPRTMQSEYLTDDGPTPLEGGEAAHFRVTRYGLNGDVYIGTRATDERIARTVRFRMANGGASDYRRLRAAVVELEAAMAECAGAVHVV